MQLCHVPTHCLHWLLVTGWFASLLMLASCRGSTGGAGTPSPMPGRVTPAVPGPPAATLAPTPQARQLLIWLADDLNTTPDTPAGESFTQIVRQFEQLHTNVDVQWQLKPAAGQNSLVEFLRSAQQVAPAVVPDLILVDSRSLWQLADIGLISPLAGDMPDSWDGFFPFAGDAARYNGAQLGVPYAADVQHLAYVADRVTEPPTTWEALGRHQISYLFPVAGSAAIDAVLLQYLGAGGELAESGQVDSHEPLQALFAALDQARGQGVLPPAIQDQASLEQVWDALTAGEAVAANVAASRFRERKESNGGTLAYGQAPTQSGLPTAIAPNWALAVTAVDPEQRGLALAFIEHLLAVENHAAWSQSAGRLPTRRAAFERWSNRGDYHAFLGQLLEVAVAPPLGAPFADFGRRLRDAQLALLRGELTVEQAVQSVGATPQ